MRGDVTVVGRSITSIVTAALVIAVGGCSPQAGSEDIRAGPSGDELVRQVLAEPLPGDPGPDLGGLTLQRSILADGVVTFDQYERAMSAAAECIRSEGFTVRFPGDSRVLIVGIDPAMLLTIEVSNVEEDELLEEIEMQCRSQWSWWVEEVWQRQLTPSEEERQRALESALECGRQHGMSIAEPPHRDDHVRAYLEHGCPVWLTE